MEKLKAGKVTSLIEDKNPSVHFQEEINHYMTPTTLTHFSTHTPLVGKWTDDVIKSHLMGSSCVTLTKVLFWDRDFHPFLPNSLFTHRREKRGKRDGRDAIPCGR